MKMLNNLFALLVNATAAGVILATANGAAYIKFDGVDGEALDSSHTGWSDLASFGQGISIHQPGGGATGATRRRGDVVMEDITVVKVLDKSSPKIAEAICQGTVFPKVEIHLTRDSDAGRVTYFSYELTNVLISSYNFHLEPGTDGSELPMESFSLNFEEIKVTYTEADTRGNKKGKVEYSWKVEEGESVVEPEPTATVALAPANLKP